jgi:hypothetical protein
VARISAYSFLRSLGRSNSGAKEKVGYSGRDDKVGSGDVGAEAPTPKEKNGVEKNPRP